MRTILTLLVLAVGSSATAADVPPALMTAKVENGNLVMDVCEQVPVEKQIVVTVLVNGQQVQETRKVTVIEMVTVRQQFALKGAKATVGGKELTEKALAERLTEDTAVVTSQGPIPAKFKKLFKDDAILIEFPATPVAPVPPPKSWTA